jgi:Zn-dependent oligopeptidase
MRDREAASALLEEISRGYEALHTAKEDAFWGAMMGLGEDPAAARAEMGRRQVEVQRFLGDAGRLSELRALEASEDGAALDEADRVALRGWIRTLEAHAIESEEARALSEEIIAAEGALATARGQMKLGYVGAEGALVEAGSNQLRLMIQNEPEEALRRAAWEGLRGVEEFVLDHGFLEIVRERNRLGRMLGGDDYYDARVRRVEGMSKAAIFALLDELEEATRESARAAWEGLRAQKGPEAVRPWNLRYHVAGDVTRRKEPYFSFGASLERWGRSFAALGIDYQGARLVLDLVDRKGKYENGFMHGPEIAWRRKEGLQRARIHFTANAVPGVIGSGFRATQTLFHEGGHAAHFANVDMPAPCFGQEFAPTSVAFGETQSMFLDSLLGDADWQTRYALDAQGQPIPFALIEEALRLGQPFAALTARMMLCVCYGERALYELPDDQLTPARALETLREVERRLLFSEEGSASPVLAVPHLLSNESSAYFHGYVLASMAVHQTRNFFINRDGYLLDNPRIGPDLQRHYWAPGNSRTFSDFIQALVGAPPSARDYARALNRSADEAVEDARRQVARLPQIPPLAGPPRLNASIEVVHGAQPIAACAPDGDFLGCARDFARWIEALEADAP